MSIHLPTHILISAALTSCQAQGIFSTIIQKGDTDRGGILLKQRLSSTRCSLLLHALNSQNQTLWHAPLPQTLLTEKEADAYIEKTCRFDPDIWVLEVEDIINPFIGN